MTDAALSVIRPAQYRIPVKSLTAGMAVLKVEYTFSDSYVTGGDPFDVTPTGLAVDLVHMTPVKGYVFEADTVNKTLKAYSAANTEVAAATDLSALGVIDGVAWIVKH